MARLQCPYGTWPVLRGSSKVLLMSPKNWLPISSLLLALFLLPGCGGGLTSTPNPPPGSNPAPGITSIAPSTGSTGGGTAVTITGTGFLSGVTVNIGGSAATNVTLVSSTSITATTPAHAAGAVNVVVANTDAQNNTLTNGFTYTATVPPPPPPSNPAPTVTSISPNTGLTTGGTAVTIRGTGFLLAATVKFGGTSATGLTLVNSTTITGTAPAHAAGTVSVVVTNPDTKTGTLANGYTYTTPPIVSPAPTVTSVTPNSGTTNGGTSVAIAGTGFLAGATVRLGGTAATTQTVVNSTLITATTPAHAAGAVSVVVTNTDTQTGTLANGYTYTVPPAPNPVPTVTAVAPNTGVTTGGTAVTITGTGFLTGATVTFGGTLASGVTVVNGTTITASTPAHAAGAVNVVVINTDAKSGTLTNGYTYTTPTGTLALVNVVSGLTGPVGIERPPNDNRFFIVEQRGTVRILENGALRSGNFLDIQSVTNFDGQEQGLLGLAFHPNFATNHKFYVNYTIDNGDRESIISEFQTLSSDPNTADLNSERVLLVVNQPFPNHKGGQLVFGPDGFLYIGLGDGGSGGDPQGNGQNLTTFLGKMLRIGVDPPFATGKEYAIPADNPFAAGGGLPEIFAYGLRNPWRFSFEPVTNRLFVADVGQDSWEEINILQKGGNFGWNVMEGAHCFPPGTTTCDMTNKILPIFEYSHSDGIAVIGGYVYKGSAISSLANKYIFADLTGKVWSLAEAPANTWTRTNLLATGLTFTSFGRDAAGELYILDYNGNVLKLVLQ